jgi:hypothetical protein
MFQFVIMWNSVQLLLILDTVRKLLSAVLTDEQRDLKKMTEQLTVEPTHPVLHSQ